MIKDRELGNRWIAHQSRGSQLATIDKALFIKDGQDPDLWLRVRNDTAKWIHREVYAGEGYCSVTEPHDAQVFVIPDLLALGDGAVSGFGLLRHIVARRWQLLVLDRPELTLASPRDVHEIVHTIIRYHFAELEHMERLVLDLRKRNGLIGGGSQLPVLGYTPTHPSSRVGDCRACIEAYAGERLLGFSTDLSEAVAEAEGSRTEVVVCGVKCIIDSVLPEGTGHSAFKKLRAMGFVLSYFSSIRNIHIGEDYWMSDSFLTVLDETTKNLSYEYGNPGDYPRLDTSSAKGAEEIAHQCADLIIKL